MGNTCCKTDLNKGKVKLKDSLENAQNESEDAGEGSSSQHESEEERLEQEEINYWREQLNNDLPRFVINNALMTVQFFRNFEEDMQALRTEAQASDGIPLEEHRLKLFQADKLMDKVGQAVYFQPKHGPSKSSKTLLHSLRSYIVYDNVELKEHEEFSLGASSTSKPKVPHYRLLIETPNDDHLEHAGYMNLREIDSHHEEGIYESIEEVSNKTANSLAPSSYASPRNSDNSEDDARELKDKLLMLASRKSTLQVSTSTEEIYPYTTIQKLTEKRPVYQVRRGYRPYISCSIPRDTFTSKEKLTIQSSRRTGSKGPQKTLINYLNSAKFTRNFLDVLTERLAESLKITRELEMAQVQCAHVVVSQGKATYHIMPVLPVKFWPQIADNFFQRYDSEWPTKRMKIKIRNMGVYARSLGYLKRRGDNPEFELQWRYICPRAEEYLLLHTMHAHVRCYLFTMALFKSFLNPDDFLGLNHNHVIHLLFEELRKNFFNWPEDKPAETLIEFLKKLYKATEKRKLNNFFINGRNMLESSPMLFLNKTQGILAKLIENPLPYLLLALKNLNMKYYTNMDMSYIYKLTTTRKVIEFLNPHLVPLKKENKDEIDPDELEAYDVETRNQMLKEAYYKQQQKEKTKMAADRGSVETIKIDDIPETMKKPTGERERKRALLEKFIPHFIEMGGKSVEYRTYDQARMYLLHATRLNQLLVEVQGDVDEIESYKRKITKEQQRCEKAVKNAAEIKIPETVKPEEETGIRLSSHMRDLPSLPKTP